MDSLVGVHHISVNVSDNAVAARFYIDVLGFKELERPDFGVPGTWLEMADGRQVHLIEVVSHEAPDGQHFALRVSDIDVAVAELRGHEVEVNDPYELPGAGRQAFFKDPSGNLIELNQPTP
jgi:glyoxylase I family protein